jgi:DMSO/TMAO reductase YedYZ molybdopterin-dependent catalytic subunit
VTNIRLSTCKALAGILVALAVYSSPAAYQAGGIAERSLAPGSLAQEAPPARLAISGEVAKPLNLSAADLQKLPRHTIHAKDHSGQPVTYEGATLADVLALAGVQFGEPLRGKAMSLYALVRASDGYQVVFALPELDPASTDRTVLLAWTRDGKPLAAPEGPLRIVVPDEKRQARWVRGVVSIAIQRAS